MRKYLRISSYIWKPFLIYEFALDPIWISVREILFSFLSVQLKQGSPLFGHSPCFLEACYIRVACGRRCGAWRPSPTPASCPSVTSAPAPATAPATATAPAPGTDWPEISTPAAGTMTPLHLTGENHFPHCLFVCNDKEVAWGKQIIESCDHLHWMIMFTLDVWPLLYFVWLKCSFDK